MTKNTPAFYQLISYLGLRPLSQMDWSNSLSLQLIELYRENECLWNPKHDGYKSKYKKFEAWNHIGDVLKCDVNEVKKKMDSLLASFRRERQKQDVLVKTEDGYSSTWFAFKSMLFLMDKFTMKHPHQSEEPQINGQDSQEVRGSDVITTVKWSESETDDDSQPKRKALSTEKPKKRRLNSSRTVEEAHSMFNEQTHSRTGRDDSSIYGEYVATKHRKYTAHTRSLVEHLIGEILFNADMGQYDQ